MLRIGIKKPTDHPLILGVVLTRFILEEINAPFAQGDGYFDALISEHKVLGGRQEIGNDLNVP